MGDNGLKLEPEDRVLKFLLGPGRSKSSIRLKNVNSDQVVMYKVRLTMPMLYFANPNFNILEPGEEVEIMVAMVDELKDNFIESNARGEEISTHKHRLMVQTVALNVETGKEAIAIKKGDKAIKETFTDIWTNASSSNKSSTYLKVSYEFEDGNVLNDRTNTADTSASYLSPIPEYKSTRRNSSKPIPTTPEEVKEELIGLRNKYETLLQTCCRVQAERELLEQEREVKMGELRDVKAANDSGSLGDVMKNDRSGFSLLFFVASMVLAFMLGQYLST